MTHLYVAIAAAVAGVLAATGAFVALRWRRPDAIMTLTTDAMAAADAAIVGFGAVDAAVGDDGRSALVLGSDGRLAVVRSRGARLIGREITWTMVRNTAPGMVIETRDRHFDGLLVPGVTALDVRRLGHPVEEEQDVRLASGDEAATAA